MNLIANSCVGGWCYRIANEKFNNPFTWCMIQSKDMEAVINYYDTVKWFNIQLEIDHTNPLNRTTFNIIVDNKFTLHYTHYIWELKKLLPTPIKESVDIYSNDIYRYVVDRYKTRVTRMLENAEPPTFL